MMILEKKKLYGHLKNYTFFTNKGYSAHGIKVDKKRGG